MALAQWQQSASLYGEHSRETVEKLADLLAVIGLIPAGAALGVGTDAAEAWVIARENNRDLNSKDPVRRSQGVKLVLQGITKGQLGAESNPLISRITDMGDQNPDEAMRVLALLSALNKNTSDRQDFVPLVAAAAGVMGVLAGALVTTTATPENQARLRDAANALVDAAAQSGRPLKDQLAISAELWKFLYDTSFPADLLNDKNRALVNPILEGQGAHPTSDGYGAGSQPSTVTNTGGSQVVDPKGTDYSNPLVDLPSSGNMYSSDGAKATGNGAKFADQAKLDDHFARHGGDFGAKNTLEYQAQADKFLTASKPAGVLEKARPNGDIVRYNPGTDEFGVVSSGGSIRTYYKPDPAVHGKGSNLDYFNAQ